MCKSILLIAHLATAHFSGHYNNINPGIGVECRGENFSTAVGTFQNSYSDQSFYAMAAGNFIQTRYVLAGPFVGFASGYQQERRMENSNGQFIPFAGIRFAISLPRSFELGTILVPPVGPSVGFAHFTVAYKWNL